LCLPEQNQQLQERGGRQQREKGQRRRQNSSRIFGNGLIKSVPASRIDSRLLGIACSRPRDPFHSTRAQLRRRAVCRTMRRKGCRPSFRPLDNSRRERVRAGLRNARAKGKRLGRTIQREWVEQPLARYPPRMTVGGQQQRGLAWASGRLIAPFLLVPK